MTTFQQDRKTPIGKVECEVRVVINRDDLTAYELVAEFKAFMLAIGYHPQTVDDALGIDDIYGTAA